MKKRLTYLLFFCAFICNQSVAQLIKADTVISKNLFKFEQLIPGDYSYMNVDMFGNIYLITKSNQLKKINSKGESTALFNDVIKYGNPSSIDVSNPLKILVFYKSYSTIVTLDRLLTYRNSINLRSHQFFNVNTIAASYDNNIWLFDEQDFKIKKIDESATLINESADLRMLVDEVPAPSELLENNNQLFLYDSKKGFFVFDYYGAYKNLIPLLNWKNIAIGHNLIYGFAGAILYSYELNSLSLNEYHLPEFVKEYKSIKAINNKLYLLKKDGVEIYTIE